MLVQYFTCPGLTREITHELRNSDHYGEFGHWFHMPLMKVEELTNILIDRGYINPPRLHWRRAVFRKRSELLVMSVLYLLLTGAAFCSCKPLCGISMSEVCNFFYKFIEALVDMKDENICLSQNLTELKRLNRDYNAAGLPGCIVNSGYFSIQSLMVRGRFIC